MKTQPSIADVKDPLVGRSQHIVFPTGPNAPLSSLPRQLVYYRLPDFSRFTVSPPGHPNTLRIMGSAENITGNGGIGTSSFIARRQDAVEFTAEATVAFAPDLSDPMVDGEEAGMTLFLQRHQHFDLGVIVQRDASAANGLKKFVRLGIFTATSSGDGLSDPLSQPGIVPLPDKVDKLRLRVQAVNASTYAFSYTEEASAAKPSAWRVVGYGAASEVSGGFTGVSKDVCITLVGVLIALLFKTLVGMYATGNGHNSSTPAYFSDFTYDPVQDVF